MGLGIAVLGGRCSHIEIGLAVPVEGVVEPLVAAELRTEVIDHAVGLVLQSQGIDVVVVGVHGKLHHYIGVVGVEEVALLDVESYGEGTSHVLFLVLQGRDVFAEDLLQLLCLCVVVSHLALYELGNLHLFFTIESIGVGSSLLALFTTDDVVVAEEFHNLLHLVLDGEAGCLHIVNQQGGYVVYRGREDELVCLRNIADHEEDVDHTNG